ncbi:MAG: M23 family metallopeptidase [Nitrospiria bacterium]
MRVALPLDQVPELAGRFDGRDIPVFATPEGAGALLGIDMEAVPGPREFVWERRRAGETAILDRITFTVVSGEFGVQELTLRKDQVDLDPPTRDRVAEEQQAMLAAMEAVTPRLWDEGFVMPSEGRIQHTFGLKRVINGQPRRAHTGEDITAPLGAPVVAMSRGTVRLVADHFFNGQSIVIDHGLGLYSMYFHLSATAVKVGERVEKGQIIGSVGASGRVSGPHLHWGVRLNGARVNPLLLTPAPSAATIQK